MCIIDADYPSVSFMGPVALFGSSSRVPPPLPGPAAALPGPSRLVLLLYKTAPEKCVGTGVCCLHLVVCFETLLSKCFFQLFLNCDVVNSSQILEAKVFIDCCYYSVAHRSGIRRGPRTRVA